MGEVFAAITMVAKVSEFFVCHFPLLTSEKCRINFE